MTEEIGAECKLYRNTGTLGGSPTWNEVPNVKDLTPDLSKTKADFSARRSKWKRYRSGMKDCNITWNMIYDATDVDLEAFRDAWLNDTQAELAVADGAITVAGNEYLRAVVEIFKFTRNEPLDDAVTVDLEAAPSPHATEPSWNTAV